MELVAQIEIQPVKISICLQIIHHIHIHVIQRIFFLNLLGKRTGGTSLAYTAHDNPVDQQVNGKSQCDRCIQDLNIDLLEHLVIDCCQNSQKNDQDTYCQPAGMCEHIRYQLDRFQCGLTACVLARNPDGIDCPGHRQADGDHDNGRDGSHECSEYTGYFRPVFRNIQGILSQEYCNKRISRHQIYASFAGRYRVEEDYANQCHQAEQFLFFHRPDIIPDICQHLLHRLFRFVQLQSE